MLRAREMLLTTLHWFRRCRDVVALAAILTALAVVTTAQPPPPLGFSFTEVAARAGFTTPTIYGGQKTNRYLLETTGCGAAAFDYDGDGWLDLFVVNGTTLEGFPEGKGTHQPPLSQPARRHVRRRDRQGGPGADAAGDRAHAPATTTTTVTRTCSSRSGARTGCSATRATARSRRRPTAPAWRRRARGGARAARSSITTATGDSISSPPTTSISI